MRIIDADRAKEIAEVSLGDIFLQTALKLLIDKVPTLDAVPVVRCKDCKYSDGCNGEFGLCNRFRKVINPNGYCSYGERK